jgi:hypothetical protein
MLSIKLELIGLLIAPILLVAAAALLDRFQLIRAQRSHSAAKSLLP